MPPVHAGGAAVSPLSATQASRRPNPSKFGTGTTISPARIARVRAALDAGDPIIVAAFADLLNPQGFSGSQPAFTIDRTPAGPQTDPPTDPWQVPSGYLDPAGNSGQILSLRYDGIAAYDFALQYLLTGDETLAESSARQMDPWTGVTAPGVPGFTNPTGTSTRLNWSFQFPTMLSAASMLRESGTGAWTPARETAMRQLCTWSIIGGAPTIGSWPNTVPGSIGYSVTNNQGDFGVLLNLACSAYLGNRTLFDQAVARWKTIMAASVDSNGDLWHEVYRAGGGTGDGHSGLHYCLLSLAAKTRGAEIARANGVWLYDYEAPPTLAHVVYDDEGNAFTINGGGSLRGLWDRLMPWLAAPLTYPYNSSGDFPTGVEFAGENLGWMEILQALWPREDAQGVLDAARPTFDRYGSVFLSLTYPGLPLRG